MSHSLLEDPRFFELLLRIDQALAPGLPPLSDQAAVDILEFLHHAVACFESRYFGQIQRYYFERPEHQLRRHDPPPCSDDDVPFQALKPK